MSRLSICVTVKNRSKIQTEKSILTLFPDFIRSLANSLTINMDVELLIADWSSTDWPIKEWIEDFIPTIPIHLITIQSDKFSVGRGKNLAAQHATGDVLFFVDADMIVNKELLDFALSSVKDSVVYYPTVYYYATENHTITHEGGGNFFITRNDFLSTNKWPEYYAHGFDDVDFYQEISKKFTILTHPTISIIHQWHPQDKSFKNTYATPEGIDSIQQRKDHYLSEDEALKKDVEMMLTAPNTTHHKLKKPQRGI